MLYDVAEFVRSNSGFIAVFLALLVLVMGARERRRGRAATTTPPAALHVDSQTPTSGDTHGQ